MASSAPAKKGDTDEVLSESQPVGKGLDAADGLLIDLGYMPELSRNRSTLQVAFMSFVLASIPCGLATTLFYPLNGGGPVNIIWGWVVVSLIIICVALSLGEITSIYPTAGGVYYQTFMLAPRRWRRVAGWVCGWIMCEEVQNPSIQVPRAMVATIFINAFAGLLFLIPLVFVLPDIQELLQLASGQPVPVIIKSAVGSSGGAFALLVPLLVLLVICGIDCTTATSRCVFAFARDGAIPQSRWWVKVNHRLDNIPLNAMMLSMVVELALGLIYFGNTTAFNAFSGVGVICLTVAYASPIAINLFTGRKQVKKSRFYLGALGTISNVIAIVWTLLVIPLFCMPASIPVTASTVNYAPVVFVFAIVVSGIWYWVWGYENYVGPPTQDE
ncbi:hypothetical protein LRP88_04026 [Fusarium phalaenopsidis]